MYTSGFSNAPASRLLVIGVVLTAFLTTLTDSKHFCWIQIRPHILEYYQLWRLLTWQLCYTNSTEVLFAAMSFYQLRVIERLWGTRKFTSFLLTTYLYTSLLPPLLLLLVLRPLTLNQFNYLPAGPTPLLFALQFQFHAAIPYIYKYRVSGHLPAALFPSAPATRTQEEREYGLLLTSKATAYLLPLQLALSQFPGSVLAAGVGWVVGWAYRREILPGAARWRVPGWVIGAGGRQKDRYNSLRRRMEGEAGRATGVEGREGEGNGGEHAARRRGVVGGLLDQFRGTA